MINLDSNAALDGRERYWQMFELGQPDLDRRDKRTWDIAWAAALGAMAFVQSLQRGDT